MVSCKICKNLSKMVVESDKNGNIIKYKPNTCKITNKEINNIVSECRLDGGLKYE